MTVHYQTDYTVYFDEEDLLLLGQGKELVSTLKGPSNSPVTVSLKSADDLFTFYKGINTEYRKMCERREAADFLIFINETELAVVYWKGEEHALIFKKDWFLDLTKQMLEGVVISRTIRWGAEKITILAGEGSEAKRFKTNWS
jgi:hypothetical protein